MNAFRTRMFSLRCCGILVSLMLVSRVNGFAGCVTQRRGGAWTTTARPAASGSNSLKPAAIPLMDAGKAMARSGELVIDDISNALDIYGGGLSAAGAQIRNAGDSIAQAAASMRFKTGLELVIDELREAGTCFTEASAKCSLAVEEAQQDEMSNLVLVLEQMIEPLETTGRSFEAAGAGIQQRLPIVNIGRYLSDASTALAVVATLLPQLDASGTLAGQRLTFCADKMKAAGQELQGTKPAPAKGKSWIKGGR